MPYVDNYALPKIFRNSQELAIQNKHFACILQLRQLGKIDTDVKPRVLFNIYILYIHILNNNILTLSFAVSRKTSEAQRNKDFPTLKSCICSPLYWMLIFWFAIQQLRNLYFPGTLNPYLVQLTNGDVKLGELFVALIDNS